MGAGTAITAFAGAYQAYAQAEAGRAADSIARLNAGLAEQAAGDAMTRGDQDVAKLFRERRALAGAQRAAFAGQGIDVSDAAGTAALVEQQTAAATDTDALVLRNNAAAEAFGYRMQAVSDRLSGRQARRQCYQAAAGTLLTTGAGTYRDYERARRDRES